MRVTHPGRLPAVQWPQNFTPQAKLLLLAHGISAGDAADMQLEFITAAQATLLVGTDARGPAVLFPYPGTGVFRLFYLDGSMSRQYQRTAPPEALHTKTYSNREHDGKHPNDSQVKEGLPEILAGRGAGAA